MLTPTRARYLALTILALVILVSMENFNIAFSGLSEEEVVRQTADLRPQLAAVSLWSLVIVLSFLPHAVQAPTQPRQMLLPAALLLWSAASVAWSDNPASAVTKAAALLITNLAAWRLSALISVRDMFACLYACLGALLAASAALVLFAPSIGIVQREWQHVGNWQGMFASKQGLGMVSAVFIAIALLRFIDRRHWFHGAMCVLGISCLLGSGSRGAGVMAVVAVSCLVLSRASRRLAVLVLAIFGIVLTLAVANILYLAVTGNRSIDLFGYDVNLTERTFIWQYALGSWLRRPLQGYGLNGFWTLPTVYYGYLREHGWVLDNYHSGYVAILVETGLAGFSIFLATSLALAVKFHRLLTTTPEAGRLSLEMAVAFLIMFFTINLTETYLLRSTNFLALLFAFLVCKIFPAAAAQPARTPVLHARLAPG